MNEEQSANQTVQPETDPLEDAINQAMESFDQEAPKEEVSAAPENEEEPPVAEDAEENAENNESEESAESEGAEEDKQEEEFAAPEHWPEEDKAMLEKLDPEAKKLVMQIDKRLQGAHTRRSQELAEETRVASNIRKAFEPYQQELKMNGLDEVRAVEKLIVEYQQKNQFINRLQQNPKEVISELAAQFNIDSLDNDDAYQDPDVRQLKQEIAELKGQLHSSQQESQVSQTQQMIDAFASEKTQDGSLKHPHFDRVKTAMGALIQSGQAKDLEEAYNKALYTDPEYFQQRLDESLKAKLQEKEQSRKAEIDKAKKASKNLSGQGYARQAPKEINSIDDAFNAAMAKLGDT